MPIPPFDLEKAHRWFAVECNNRAWDLVEASERSAVQLEEMIHLAHTACYHWKQVGTELNLLRAEVLLATVYCIANREQGALIYAISANTRMSQVAGCTLFDRTSLAGVAAMAYHLADQTQKVQELREEFQQLLSEIEDEQEAELLRRLYAPTN